MTKYWIINQGVAITVTDPDTVLSFFLSFIYFLIKIGICGSILHQFVNYSYMFEFLTWLLSLLVVHH